MQPRICESANMQHTRNMHHALCNTRHATCDMLQHARNMQCARATCGHAELQHDLSVSTPSWKCNIVEHASHKPISLLVGKTVLQNRVKAQICRWKTTAVSPHTIIIREFTNTTATAKTSNATATAADHRCSNNHKIQQ